MKVNFHRKFKKQYKRLPIKFQKKATNILKTFEKDPFHPRLKSHKLSGDMKGKNSISVTGDIRIIFQEFDGYTLVLMISIGGHEDVYK